MICPKPPSKLPRAGTGALTPASVYSTLLPPLETMLCFRFAHWNPWGPHHCWCNSPDGSGRLWPTVASALTWSRRVSSWPSGGQPLGWLYPRTFLKMSLPCPCMARPAQTMSRLWTVLQFLPSTKMREYTRHNPTPGIINVIWKLKGKLLTLIVSFFPSCSYSVTEVRIPFAPSVSAILNLVYAFLAKTAVVLGILHSVSSQTSADNKKSPIILLARLLHFLFPRRCWLARQKFLGNFPVNFEPRQRLTWV